MQSSPVSGRERARHALASCNADPELRVQPGLAPMRPSLWEAVLLGTWSVVGQFDADGRRFLIARPCRTALNNPRRLTERERQVVQLITNGMSSKQIASELGLTAPTVSQHVAKLLWKLGSGSLEEMLLFKVAVDAADGVRAPWVGDLRR